ncbi:ThiF family adenylyltransferase [Falsirhodobacter sp. alg1]|uniref:ThiF family adenylyltransferase n=1 Tax=Falsirhodobacter sp. alg1 TaxID=1472418 RepID=UPI0005EDE4CA|nr:ThiF family adenylyltransferase [Falsirhodobacter sp. alg1]
MPHPLIAHNPDLARLQDEGFDIEINGNHLVVHDVPYVNDRKEVCLGKLVSDLTLSGDVTVSPQNHVAMFAGDQPCDMAGQPIAAITYHDQRQDLGGGLIVDRAFSNKPLEGYRDYYHKITTYVGIISNPAAALDPSATPRTFQVRGGEENSPFQYLDTASTRAGISQITDKLAVERAVIVGLGGTGAYLLDLLAKTPVRRIDLFDGDRFLQHNAFRGPGAPSVDILRTKPWKVDYWHAIYSNMHKGIVANRMYLGDGNLEQLAGADIVFLCMDAGPAKMGIIRGLERLDLPFIDVGMGLDLVDDHIIGQVRVTSSTREKRDHVWNGRVAMTGGDNDLYGRNIQVADLNALNATLAIGRWKRMVGFYLDLEHEHHSVYAVDGNHLLNEERLP